MANIQNVMHFFECDNGLSQKADLQTTFGWEKPEKNS